MLTRVHCHQHAVLGWDADEKLLTAAGARPGHLEAGCCRLAGDFGFQVCHGGRPRPQPSRTSSRPAAPDSRGKQRRFIRKALPAVLVAGSPWQPY